MACETTVNPTRIRSTTSDSLRVPSQVCWVNKEDASAGHGGQVGFFEVTHLKHEPHGWLQRYALIAGQCQYLYSIFLQLSECKILFMNMTNSNVNLYSTCM